MGWVVRVGCVAAVLAAADAAWAVTAPQQLAGKKAVFVIAPEDFRDEEIKEPRTLLEGKGCTVTVACTSVDEVRGMRGAKVTPDVLLKDVKAADYDAVVFVGGMGARVYFDDKTAHALAKAAVDGEKVVGALCFASTILARAGALKGKVATSVRSQRQELTRGGAKWSSESVVRHGNVITANGPMASERFGQFLAQSLAGEARTAKE